MATKKRPADEPAKDWEKTLEPVRKLAAIIRAVEKVPSRCFACRRLPTEPFATFAKCESLRNIQCD
jgi:hypothetical protein